MLNESTCTSRNQKISALLASALLIFNIVCLCIYNVRTVRGLLTSDAAAKNLIAGEMARSSSMFPPDWYYVNGDLWTFFSHLLILPLLPFFSNGFALHAFAGIATATLLLFVSWWLLRLLRTSFSLTLLTLAVMASGISSAMAWFIFGETAYGWVLLASLLFLLLLLPFFDEKTQRRSAYVHSALLLLLAVLSFVVHLGNPARAIASFSIPAAGGLATLLYTSARSTSQQHWRHWASAARLPFAALFIGGLIGSIVHSLLIPQLNNTMEAGAATFIPFERIGRAVGYTLLGLISLMGGEPIEGVRLPTLPGVAMVIRLIAAVLMIVLPLWTLRYYFYHLKPTQQFAAGFAVTAFAIVMLVCLLTNTPDYTNFDSARASTRYFAPSLILLMLVFASSVHSIQSKVLRALAFGTALVVSTSAWAVLVRDIRTESVDVRSAVLKLLRENDLKYGYASFWNSGVYTVLSGQEIKVRQVQLENTGIFPMRHLGAGHWYEGQEWSGRTFLLVTDKEHQLLRERGLLDCLGAPIQTLAAPSMRVLVYPENLSARLFGWDLDRNTFERTLCLLPNTLRTVGKYVPESRVLVAVPEDGSGFLMFGPYISLRAGDYLLRATVSIESLRNESAGIVDVTGEGGGTKFAAVSLPARSGSFRVELPFTLPRDARAVEFRTSVSSSATVTLRSVSLARNESFRRENSAIVLPIVENGRNRNE